MGRPYKEITLTLANQSENMTNPAGCLEIDGNFAGPAFIAAATLLVRGSALPSTAGSGPTHLAL